MYHSSSHAAAQAAREGLAAYAKAADIQFLPHFTHGEPRQQLITAMIAALYHFTDVFGGADTTAAINDAAEVADRERCNFERYTRYVAARARVAGMTGDVPVTWDRTTPADNATVRLTREAVAELSCHLLERITRGEDQREALTLGPDDTAVIYRYNADGEPTRHDYAPDNEGTYVIGRHLWTWEITSTEQP